MQPRSHAHGQSCLLAASNEQHPHGVKGGKEPLTSSMLPMTDAKIPSEKAKPPPWCFCASRSTFASSSA
eukprot:51490-Eustigmatos_ZCMA.PRE.1